MSIIGHAHFDTVCGGCGIRTGGCRCMEPNKTKHVEGFCETCTAARANPTPDKTQADGFISIPCPEFYGRPIRIRTHNGKMEYAEGTEGYEHPRVASMEEEALFQAVKESLTVAARPSPASPAPQGLDWGRIQGGNILRTVIEDMRAEGKTAYQTYLRQALELIESPAPAPGADTRPADLEAIKKALAWADTEAVFTPASSVLEAAWEALRKLRGGHSMKIGGFTLHPYANGRYGLYKESGEGGEFDASKLEKHLEELYDREF